MKKIYAIIATFAVVSLAATGIYAWRGGPGQGYGWGGCYGNNYGKTYGHGYGYGRGMGLYWNITELKNELGLTNQQVDKITKINKDFDNKYDKNRGNRAKMWSLHNEHKKAIEAVLTKQQLNKLNENSSYCWLDRRGFRR